MKGAYFKFGYNKQDFKMDEFGEEKFMWTLMLEGNPLGYSEPTLKPYSVQITELNDQSSYWPFTSPQNSTYYNLKEKPSFPYYDDLPNLIGGVIVKMDYDKLIIDRAVYSASSWLEAVGGFMGSI